MNLLADTLFDGWERDSRVFLRLPSGETTARRDFMNLSSRLAAHLCRRGIRPGDRLAVQVEKSPEALALYAACIRAGAVFLPLNTAYTPAEIAYFLADAEPALFICDRSWEASSGAEARKVGVPVSFLNADGSGDLIAEAEAEGEAGAVFENVPRDAQDSASILYTSGTTGSPKGAVLSHLNLLSNAQILARTWSFEQSDVLLHALPIFHVHGLFTASNTAIVAGASMLFLRKFDAAEVCRLLPQATVMMGVPTYYTRMLSRPELSRDSASHMRLFISGSAPLLPETHADFQCRTGHRILERYGMSETGMNASNPYDGERRPGAVGFPLSGVDIRIVDEQTGEPLPHGKVGAMEVKGENVFSCYWKKREQTAAAFRKDGYFITGDVGKFDDDGYLYIVGRAKDMIISGGLNVYPKEVEEVVNNFPGVLESAVVGAPHPDFGECVVAAVVARPGHELSPEDIKAALSQKLAKFKIPRRFFLEDELPRNTMGKVQKNILREKYRGCFS